MFTKPLIKLKISLLILFLFGFLFFLTLSFSPVFAQNDYGPTPTAEEARNDYGLTPTARDAGFDVTKKELPVIIGGLIKIILSFLGIVLILLIIYAGFLWMTSRGDEDKIKKAKGILTNAVIGLIIVIAAYAITWFVMTQVTGMPKASSEE